MSTGIEIKKKLAILNEGANVTTDATSIDFVGSGVNSSTVGNNVTVTIPGGSGTTTYYLNQTVTQAPYKEFSSVATAAAEQVVPLTVSAGATSVIAEFQTPTGVPNTTQIPGGLWQFFLHFNAGAVGQNWIIRPTVYKRDLGGIETLLFTPDPEIVTNMSTTTTMYISDGVFPSTTLVTTDRIVVRISIQNTTGVSQTVSFRTEGSQHYSVGLTTLNQVVGAGSVTSVIGTAPIVSSGGLTPAISIPQATNSVNGYLSSSDWSIFSAKVGGSGTTNYLSKFTGSGFSIGDSIILDNGTVAAIGNIVVDVTKKLLVLGNAQPTALSGYNTYAGSGTQIGADGQSYGAGTGKNVGVQGAASTNSVLNIGVSGFTQGASVENIGGKFAATGATSNYSLQLTDGTEGVGKFLKSITADGKAQWATIATGLTYFTEAQNTTAPNATVPVDSLTAVASTTDADIALLPKGTGAFIVGHIPDGTPTNGGKRGNYAVDIQPANLNYSGGASGANAVAIGYRCQASGANSTAIGSGAYSSAANAMSFVANSNNGATGISSLLLGSNGDGNCTASGASSVSISGGYATADGAFAQGGSTASGILSVAMGGYVYSRAIASARCSFAVGETNTADARSSVAFGINASTKGVAQRLSLGSFQDVNPNSRGNSQLSLSSSTTTTTTNTAIELVAYNGTEINLVLQNNEAIRVRGSIIGKQTASTNVACYDFDCIVVRGTTAGSTILPLSNVNLVLDTITLGTIPTLTANTTLGGLSVKSGAKTTTTIKWSCRIDSTEVILA